MRDPFSLSEISGAVSLGFDGFYLTFFDNNWVKLEVQCPIF